jgi:uncharacterized OsmC-like protein
LKNLYIQENIYQSTGKMSIGVMSLGKSESGHVFVMDGALQSGGRNMGLVPMERLLLGMSRCWLKSAMGK